MTAILATAATLAAAESECPYPYEPLDDTRCIFLDPYAQRTFNETDDWCKTHLGAIVHYQDCYTASLVYDYIKANTATANKHYWVGATDIHLEGDWKFTTQKKAPMGVPFWGTGRPTTNEDMNCAMMHASYNHYWYDSNCDGKNVYAICLRHALNTGPTVTARTCTRSASGM